MLNFLKKKKNTVIYSPAKGKIIPIEDVPDEVFASKMMGDGFGIYVEEGEILSPVDGVVSTMFPTGHALGLKADEIEIIIHVGIDTINLKGQGFTKLKNEGEHVKKGDPLLKVDWEFLKNQGFENITMVVFPNASTNLSVTKAGKAVDAREEIAVMPA